jgi:hypothetical protein
VLLPPTPLPPPLLDPAPLLPASPLAPARPPEPDKPPPSPRSERKLSLAQLHAAAERSSPASCLFDAQLVRFTSTRDFQKMRASFPRIRLIGSISSSMQVLPREGASGTGVCAAFRTSAFDCHIPYRDVINEYGTLTSICGTPATAAASCTRTGP